MDGKGHLASIARNQNITRNKSPLATPAAAAGVSRAKDLHTSVSLAMLPMAKIVTDNAISLVGDLSKQDNLRSMDVSKPALREMSLDRSADSRSRRRSITPTKRSQSVTSLSKKNGLPAKGGNVVGSTKNQIVPTLHSLPV